MRSIAEWRVAGKPPLERTSSGSITPSCPMCTGLFAACHHIRPLTRSRRARSSSGQFSSSVSGGCRCPELWTGRDACMLSTMAPRPSMRRSTVCISCRSMSSRPRAMRWRRRRARRRPRFARCRSRRSPPGRSIRCTGVAGAAFHALTAAAAALRDAHTAVVTGKKADLRAAGKAHEDALDAVVKVAVAILRDAGQPATDATRQAIATTLRALPGLDRSSRTPHASAPADGFELLAGLPAAVSPGRPGRPRRPRRRRSRRRRTPKKDAARDKAVAKAKEAAAAVRAERTAEQNARREEFEAARMTRDAERAASDLAKARAALEAAQDAVDDCGARRSRPRRARRMRRRGACGKPPKRWPRRASARKRPRRPSNSSVSSAPDARSHEDPISDSPYSVADNCDGLSSPRRDRRVERRLSSPASSFVGNSVPRDAAGKTDPLTRRRFGVYRERRSASSSPAPQSSPGRWGTSRD